MSKSQDRARKMALYEARKAQGLCYYCGKPADEGKGSCQPCRARRKGTSKRQVQRKRAAAKLGICVSCLKSEAMPGRRLCGACREYHDEATAKWRARAIEVGKCHSCGARDPEPGYVRCAKCRAQNQRAKVRYAQRRKLRKAVAA